jgi:hypothetical protein
MKEEKHQGSRRAILSGAASMATALGLEPHAVFAEEVRGVNGKLPKKIQGINKYLTNNGWAPFEPLADGFSPLMLIIGARPPANIDGEKFLPRNFDGTLLVRFPYPQTWLIQQPAFDSNAESGNIRAVNNFKAESAVFVATRLPDGVKTLEDLSNDVLGKTVTSNYVEDIQDLKIKNKKIVKTDDGQDVVRFATSWTVIARSGFEIRVLGYHACFIRGNAVVGVATTYNFKRQEEMKDVAQYIAENTRIYEIPTPKDFMEDDD